MKHIIGYRCNAISAVDGFLSATDVLRLEMFGEEGDVGFRNFEGVISNLQEIYPMLNSNLIETILQEIGCSISALQSDENIKDAFAGKLAEHLVKDCNIPEDYLNYGIWLCDSPENVVDTYGVDINDVSKYKLNGYILQDLKEEGKLYGVKDYPEEILGETMKFTSEDFEKLYEECVCAGGSSGIAACAPEHVLGTMDAKIGKVSGPGYFARGAGTDFAFTNDTMKVHKNRKGKKGDAITGTGIVYANGKMKEAIERIFDEFDELDNSESSHECCNCGMKLGDGEGEYIYGDLYCSSCAEHEKE